MNNLSEPEFPLDFRQEVFKPIFATVSAGDSCLIIGIGSVGKSNLLRSLQRESTQQIYLKNARDSFLFVYADVNKTLEHSLWGLLELILHQIIIELSTKEVDEKTLSIIDDLHQRATAFENRYLALRYLDRAVRLVCHQLGLRLVLLIDEFDALCKVLSPADFAALRALRDDNKYQLMYVVASRSELGQIRGNPEEIEAFEELVSLNTIWIGPFSKADAYFVLQRLEARYGVFLDAAIQHTLLVATGGHPGLLRAAYAIAMHVDENLLNVLALSPQIKNECERIWNSLNDQEQEVLNRLVTDAFFEEQHDRLLDHLRHKGLVGGPWATNSTLSSTLFAEFVNQQRAVADAHIHIDRERRIVWVDGRAVQGLSRLEFRFIEYLESKRGQVCSQNELAECLYPEDMAYNGAGVTDARLAAVAKRVRKQIESDPRKPRYLITVRGHGYQLIDENDELITNTREL